MFRSDHRSLYLGHAALALFGLSILLLLVGPALLWEYGPSAFCLGIAGVAFFPAHFFRSDLLSPRRLFAIVWFPALFLASLHLTNFIRPWDLKLWFLFIVAYIAFWVGGFLINPTFSEIDSHASLTPRAADEVGCIFKVTYVLRWRRVFFFIVLLTCVGTLALGYEYWQIRTIPILASNVDQARFMFIGYKADPRFDVWYNKVVHLFVACLKYGFFLSVFCLMSTKSLERWKRVALYLLAAWAFLAFSSQGARQFPVELICYAAVVYHFVRRRLTVGKTALLCCVVLVLLDIVGIFRIQASRGQYNLVMYQQIYTATPEWLLPLIPVYTALTYSFEVFDRLAKVIHPNFRLFGYYSFYFLHRFLPRGNLENLADLISPPWVTPTFLGVVYFDWGLPGVLVWCTLLGCTYQLVYKKLRERGSPALLYAYCVLVFHMLYFIYQNLFLVFPQWIMDFACMFGILSYCVSARPERDGVSSSLENNRKVAMAGRRVGNYRATSKGDYLPLPIVPKRN